MRRLIFLILVLQALLTTYVVVRDLTGLPSIPLFTIISTALAFSFALLHAGMNLGWRRAALFIAITVTVALTYGKYRSGNWVNLRPLPLYGSSRYDVS